MTEVPEHLLRRSRERREALGLATPGEGEAPAPAAAPAAPAAPAEPAAAPAEAAPATPAVAQRPAAGGVPAVIEPSPYIAPPPPPKRIPTWMYPVLAAMPFWAVVYFGAFGNHQAGPVDPLVLGQSVFTSAGCAGCHGATGGGGVGPPLHGGLAKITFPNIADHVNWVKTGSAPFKGKPYGAANRSDGKPQHIATTGLMPAFAGSLTDEQINDVVMYEREKL
jgi:mono/diheme cytochrome c family protein